MYNYKNFSTLFVSQSFGLDGANGLSPRADKDGNAPLRTVESAVELVKKLRADGVERPFTIAIADDYYTDKPIEIRGVDKLTVESYGNIKRIIGGARIYGFKSDIFNGVACISARVSGEISERGISDLFINGNRAAVTRFPKDGTLRVKATDTAYKEGKPETLLENVSSFTLYTDDLTGIDGIENSTVNFYHYWIDEHIPVKSYDKDSGVAELEYKTRFTATALYDTHGSSAVRYYLTGIPSTFREAGEWYFDKSASRLYYIPKDGECVDDIEAIVPLTDKLFVIEGSDVRLSHLELCYTRSDYASRYSLNPETKNYEPSEEKYGADIQSVCWENGAIIFKGVRGGVFFSSLHGLGVHALELAEGCRAVCVDNNDIYDIAAGGVKIVGGLTDGEKNEYCKVRRNEIHGVGKRFSAGCGILLMHAHDTEISENEIHDTGYSAISLGWVWGYADNPSYGNIVRANHIYDIGRGDLSDIGGIYTLGAQVGTQICENRIHDIRCRNYGAWGIYLDQGSSYMSIENNVVYRTMKTCFQLHYGKENVVRNNIFVAHGTSCLRGQRDEEHSRMVFENNILIANERPIYSLYTQLQHGIGSGRNIIWSLKEEAPFMYNVGDDFYTFDRWQNELGFDEGSIIADPKLPALSEYDFTISPDSPAIALGFKPLPENVAKPKICK